MIDIAKAISDKLTVEEQLEVIEYMLDDVNYSKPELTSDLIAGAITFENCNEIARALCLKDDTIAKGLMEELKYWYRGEK